MTIQEVKISQPSSVDHGGTEGIVLPAGTTAERPSSPDKTLRGNTELGTLEFYIAGAWHTYAKAEEFVPTVSSDLTAKSNAVIPVDTTSNGVDIELPPSPFIGDTVTLIDTDKKWGTNPVTVKGNGNKIESANTDKVLNSSGSLVVFTYLGATTGWKSNLPVITKAAIEVQVAEYPATLESNELHTLPLNPAGTPAFVFPDNPEAGDIVDLVSSDDVTFSEGSAVARQAGTGERIMGASTDYLITADTLSLQFTYSGTTTGWILTKDMAPTVRVFNDIPSTNLNGLVNEGKYKVTGATGSFSNLPDGSSASGTFNGIIDVSNVGDVAIQELITTNDVDTGKNTRKYMRNGKIQPNGTVVYNSVWVEVKTTQSGNMKQLTASANIFDGYGEGSYYFTAPTSGTPDHVAGDHYSVTITSQNTGDPDLKAQAHIRHITAYNMSRGSWWEAWSNNISTVRGWRLLNRAAADKVTVGQTINFSPYAQNNLITVESTGNQTIAMTIGTTVANSNSAREGDIISIRNLKDTTGTTTITSDVPFLDIEGTDVGVGPHTMTGKGALEAMVVVDSNNYKLQILIGVKQS